SCYEASEPVLHSSALYHYYPAHWCFYSPAVIGTSVSEAAMKRANPSYIVQHCTIITRHIGASTLQQSCYEASEPVLHSSALYHYYPAHWCFYSPAVIGTSVSEAAMKRANPSYIVQHCTIITRHIGASTLQQSCYEASEPVLHSSALYHYYPAHWCFYSPAVIGTSVSEAAMKRANPSYIVQHCTIITRHIGASTLQQSLGHQFQKLL
ncbi:hypothetical protein J6590_085872, partial [Homalodisca vitripennis]